jgi:hypothetical protein
MELAVGREVALTNRERGKAWEYRAVAAKKAEQGEHWQ